MNAAARSVTPRAVARSRFEADVRLTLVEDDLDELDTGMDALRSEFRSDLKALREEIAATRQVLTGILIAIVVASVMLAINLAIAKIGG